MSVECIQPWLAHRPRRGATLVDTVVLHASATGDVTTAVREFKDQGLSCHYLVDKAGTPHKCVPYSAVAFHAGNSFGPHEATRGTSRQQDGNFNFVEMTSVNEYSIGLCLVNLNDGIDFYPQEQFDGTVRLLKDLRGVLPSLKYLTTHYWVSPGRKTDPDGFDVVRIARLTGLEIWVGR